MHTNKVTKNIAILMAYFCMLHSHKRLHAHIEWTKILMVADP